MRDKSGYTHRFVYLGNVGAYPPHRVVPPEGSCQYVAFYLGSFVDAQAVFGPMDTPAAALEAQNRCLEVGAFLVAGASDVQVVFGETVADGVILDERSIPMAPYAGSQAERLGMRMESLCWFPEVQPPPDKRLGWRAWLNRRPLGGLEGDLRIRRLGAMGMTRARNRVRITEQVLAQAAALGQSLGQQVFAPPANFFTRSGAIESSVLGLRAPAIALRSAAHA